VLGNNRKGGRITRNRKKISNKRRRRTKEEGIGSVAFAEEGRTT